ncbi:MAG: acyl-CoA dehydrogenase family protein [Actinomycetota bacterium]
MNFDLDQEDLELQNGIRDLCAGRFSAREARPGDLGFWDDLREAGVFSLRAAEPDGLGLGMTQATLVYEELGRALVPGPLVGTFLAGRPDGVAGLVERGTSVVEHLEALDELLVSDDDGLWRVDPSELHGEPVDRPLDPLTPLHRVGDLPQGERVGAANRSQMEAATLTAALSLGIAEAATDLAVAYAKEREQFGRPIGSFQAVKHLCADMLVRAEVARAAVYAAAVLLDEGDAHGAVHAAKLLASEAAVVNGKTCIQVHGGMGFTWEAVPHLYLKRAMVLATHFGGVDSHAEAMLAHL